MLPPPLPRRRPPRAAGGLGEAQRESKATPRRLPHRIPLQRCRHWRVSTVTHRPTSPGSPRPFLLARRPLSDPLVLSVSKGVHLVAPLVVCSRIAATTWCTMSTCGACWDASCVGPAQPLGYWVGLSFQATQSFWPDERSGPLAHGRHGFGTDSAHGQFPF
jgi:hypothetical protein